MQLGSYCGPRGSGIETGRVRVLQPAEDIPERFVSITQEQGPGAGTAPNPLRVVVLGYGNIGAVVCQRLAANAVAGARLVGIVNRSSIEDAPAPELFPTVENGHAIEMIG